MKVIEALDEPVEPYAPAQGGAVDLDLVRALHAAQAEIQRLKQDLVLAEQRAGHDPLTGLLNRRGFEEALTRTLAACRRYRTEASLIYVDLDGFKAVNDTFGHAAGDAVLKVVAETLAAGVRESDVVARLGGDEFALILNRADHAAARAKAEALASAVEAAPVPSGGPVRLSFGVRSYEAGMSAAQMLAEADAAMFLHKGGRVIRLPDPPR